MNAIQLLATQPLVERLGITLVHFLWQGTLIAAAYAAARLLPGGLRRPQGRYLLASVAMLAMAAAPVVTFAVASGHTLTTARLGQVALPAGIAPVPGASWGWPEMALWQQALPWIVMVWMAGVAILSARVLAGCVLAARMRSIAVRPAPAEWCRVLQRLTARMGVWRYVRLFVSPLVPVPNVVGWLRPVILVPVGAFAGLPADQMEALLAHELAHVRRHDYLVNLLQGVVESLLFYHPAVWWVSDQMRAEREHCCDDMAVAASGDVLTYAKALAELETQRPLRLQAGVAATGGSLRKRISRLLGQSPAPGHNLPAAAGALMVALLIVVAVGTAVSRAQVAKGGPRDQAGVSVDASQVIHRPAVPYPLSARQKRIEGTVTAEVTVDADGSPMDARILSGPDELRKTVLQSVLQWHFMGGAAGSSRLVSVTFGPSGATTVDDSPEPSRDEQMLRTQKFLQDQVAAAQEQLNDAVLRRQDTARLQEQMVEAEKRLEAAVEARNLERARGGDFAEAAVDLEQRARELKLLREQGEQESADLQRRVQKMAEGKDMEYAAQEMEARSQQLQMLKAQMDSLQALAGYGAAGRTVYGVETQGITDEASRELLARLPVHAGDMLTHESIDALRAVVREFDAHLELGFSLRGDHEVAIQIRTGGVR